MRKTWWWPLFDMQISSGLLERRGESLQATGDKESRGVNGCDPGQTVHDVRREAFLCELGPPFGNSVAVPRTSHVNAEHLEDVGRKDRHSLIANIDQYVVLLFKDASSLHPPHYNYVHIHEDPAQPLEVTVKEQSIQPSPTHRHPHRLPLSLSSQPGSAFSAYQQLPSLFSLLSLSFQKAPLRSGSSYCQRA